MDSEVSIPNGLYVLVKWEEDENPLFSSQQTVVDVEDGWVTNLSTGRGCLISVLGDERSLFGPLRDAYDGRYIYTLKRHEFPRRQVAKSPSRQVAKSPSRQVAKSPSRQVAKSPSANRRQAKVPRQMLNLRIPMADHHLMPPAKAGGKTRTRFNEIRICA